MVLIDPSKEKINEHPFSFKVAGIGQHKGYDCKGPKITNAYALVELSQKVILKDGEAETLQKEHGNKGGMYIKARQIALIHEEFQDDKGQPDETKIMEFLKSVSPKTVNTVHEIQVKAIAANDEK
jgi:hypothetical protein